MQHKILMLHSSSDMYGASKIFFIMVLLLRDMGHEVYVALSEEGELAGAIRAEGVEVHIIRLGILRRKYFSPKGLINRIGVIRDAHRSLVELVKQKEVNHLYSNTTAVLVGAWVAREHRVYHTWHIHEIIAQPKWLGWILGKIVGKYADRIIVVSQAVKQFWSKTIVNKDLKVIYNGLDYSSYMDPESSLKKELSIPADHLVLGMIGRISQWKGQGYFLDIAKLLILTHPKLTFVIAGDAFPGSEHLVTEMQHQIKVLGLEKNVHVLGFRKDVPQIMAALDIFVLPSILPDPLPTVILEAMASGKPVAATAHGGACEMVENNHTGYLIPWDDAAKAAEIILPLITDGELRQEMGKKGRQRVLEHFSLEAFRKSIRECFWQDGRQTTEE
jgi:glycosyltransferase involved in cell wall biosynthesis